MRNILRITAIAVSLTLVISAIGACDKVKQFSAVGTYTSEQNDKKYRELKSDGTCFIQELTGAVTCTYEIDGSQLTIKASNGMALRAKLEANTIVDSDGERWTKK